MFENIADVQVLAQAAIPEGCRTCPVQLEKSFKLGHLLLLEYVTTEVGSSLVEEPGQRFDEIIDSNMPPEIAEQVKTRIRQEVGNDLENLDNLIETIKADMAGDTNSCDRPLAFRAEKAGTTYTATICTSRRVNVSGIKNQLPATIRIQS